MVYNVSSAETAVSLKSVYSGSCAGGCGGCEVLLAPLGSQKLVAPPPAPWTDSLDPWAQPLPPLGIAEREGLVAFGQGGKRRGKGKDGLTPPMQCYNRFRKGHPSFKYPSAQVAGHSKGGGKCNDCSGYGHDTPACASNGGGKVHLTKGKR